MVFLDKINHSMQLFGNVLFGGRNAVNEAKRIGLKFAIAVLMLVFFGIAVWIFVFANKSDKNTLETIAFENLSVMCTGATSGGETDGVGYNEFGMPVKRCLWFAFDMPKQIQDTLKQIQLLR